MIAEQKPLLSLRPYQAQATDQIREYFTKGKRKVVFVLPTGGGKTVCFSDMISKTLRKKERSKTLILTHRAELLTQAGSTLSKFGIYPACLVKETKDKDIDFGARCMVAMVETYDRRLRKFPQLADYDLVIIDEAHIGNFKKIFKTWSDLGKDLFVIGATATPISSKKRDPLKNYYSAIVSPTDIDELIEIKSLVPARTFSANFDRSVLKSDSTNEDGYSERSQMLEFDKRAVYDGLIDKFKKHCLKEDGSAKRTIVFNINVKHSKEVCQSFIDAGFRARHIDGDNKEERLANLEAFDRGEFEILCNCNILTAGYDNPSVEVIVVNKATKSVAAWLQMCGRGSRLFPGKEYFTILDMAMNWSELRLWESARDWEKVFWAKINEREPGAAPAKQCPECERINPASAKVCKECGYEFPIKPKGEPGNPDFIQITDEVISGMSKERKEYILSLTDYKNKVTYDNYDVETIYHIQLIKGYGIGFILKTLKKKSPLLADFHRDIMHYSDLRNYHPGWAMRHIAHYKAELEGEI